jgi:hypothetical protein
MPESVLIMFYEDIQAFNSCWEGIYRHTDDYSKHGYSEKLKTFINQIKQSNSNNNNNTSLGL